MKSNQIWFVVVASFIALLSGCGGPTIGLRTDFKQANFEVRKTTKNDVINYLGLPQKMIKDSEGREHYFYHGSTRLVGACVGCGNVNGGVGAVPSLINQAAIDNGVEYIFDASGLLIDKYESSR